MTLMPSIPLAFRRPIAVGLLVFSVVTLAAGLFLNHFLADLPAVHRLGHYTPSLVTKVYDVRGELITELFVEKRSVRPLSDVPLALRQAFLATEDKRFYDHMGVDPQGIFRAVITNLRARRMRQGASTITQQLAKNIFLTRERTLSRKIKELILTLQIEYLLSKDEILQLYMNQIYFGHGAYGIESAARTFFGKDVRALTLPECALLAGLPKGPERFSPFRHPERAFRRRNIVLQRMKEEEFITEHDLLKSMGISHSFKRKPVEKVNAAYFIETVRIQLEPKYGADTLYKGGLSIYTTMDLRMQKAAEETTQKHWAAFDENYAEQRLMALLKSKKISPEFLDRWRKWKADPKTAEEPDDVEEPVPVQGALVCIDPHTGGVRALVGGRNFQESQFNRATQAKRQPGSTFKPFVWQAALDSGLTAATVVDDWPIAYTDMEHNPRLVAEATDYAVLKEMVTDYYKVPRAPDAPDPIWAPQNWDNKFLGPITLRRGFALSRNLVSVRLIDRVGPAAVAKTARQAGISSPLEAVLSLGLGSSVVTPLELVSAVGTYANAGVHMRPFMVTRVVDRTGNVLEENVIQGSPGPSPQSAYLVTRLMQAVVQEGTAGYARNLGRPAAGKTGTTQDMRDLWFVGFVPDLVTGVWLGYDDFTPLGKKLTSSGTTVPIWTDFMAEAAKYVPNRDFSVPPGIVFSKIDRDTGFLALPTCTHVVLEGFREGLAPTVFCPTNHDAEEPPLDQDVTE
jgi:penicillin-binding protein 1A